MNKQVESETIIFILLSLSFFGISIAFTVFPLLILPLEESLNISHSLAGLLYTTMFISSGIGRFIESFGADHYGRQIFLLYSGFLTVVGAVGFAVAPTYWLICIGIFLMGLGNGLFIPAGFAAVSDLFPQQRGKFIGLYDSIFPLSALGAYGVTSIGTALGSWRFAVGLIAVYLFVVFVVLNLTYSLRQPAGRSAAGESFTFATEFRRALEAARNNAVFLKMVLLIIPVSIFAKGAINFLPAYMVQSRGLSQGLANLLYIVFMGLIIPGKTVSGRELDSKGARWTFLFDIGFILLGLSLFSQVPGMVALILGIILVAPARGGVYTIMHAHLLDSLPEPSVNLLYGLFMVSMAIFGAIGPGLVGVLIDNIGYKWSFFTLIFVVVLTIPIGFSLQSQTD